MICSNKGVGGPLWPQNPQNSACRVPYVTQTILVSIQTPDPIIEMRNASFFGGAYPRVTLEEYHLSFTPIPPGGRSVEVLVTSDLRSSLKMFALSGAIG